MSTPSELGDSSAIGCADVAKDHEPDFSCQFDRPWFGASYPDSYCVDGYLHDADSDGYIPSDTTNPCPRCNTKTYLEYAFDEAGGTEYLGWGTGAGMTYVTGDDIWEIAKKWARQENPQEADALIAALEKLNEPRGLSASEAPISADAVTNNASPLLPDGYVAGWQDISTAPKDGTEVVLFYPHYLDGGFVTAGYFHRETDDYVSHWYADLVNGCASPPTHWMPLPSSPRAALSASKPDDKEGG